MPRLSEVFHGKSYSAADLDRDLTLTISDVEVKHFDDGTKLVISFREGDQTLICNKTNANTIGDLYGEDTDDWIGQRITLYRATVDFQGKRVPAIRVSSPRAARPAGKPARPMTQQEADDPDGDDIPF